VKKIKFLTDEEVEEINLELCTKIDGYVNENIVNWTEMCGYDEEAESLEFFLEWHCPSWRVRNDGTIDVIIEGMIESKSRESFDFKWKDWEGKERTSNALDLLRGKVSHEFDDDCNNDFVWSRDIEKEVITLFE
jgi:hypothetical protein